MDVRELLIRSGTAPLASLTSIFSPCPTTWLLTTTGLPSQYPCFPTRESQNIAGAGFQYYSPAICPRGFVAGPSYRVTKPRTNERFPVIAPGETAAYCVPSGQTCATDTSDIRGSVWGFARAATAAGSPVTLGPALKTRWVEADPSMLETHPLTPGLKFARTGPAAAEATHVSTTTVTEPSTTFVSLVTSVSTESGNPNVLITDSRTIDPDATASIRFTTDGTSLPGPATTAGAIAGGSSGGLSRNITIIIVVSVTVVVGIALWALVFLLIRRYRAGKLKGRGCCCCFGLGRGDDIYHDDKRSARSSHMLGKQDKDKIPGAELGIPPGYSELDSGPMRGSTPNPAELDGRGVGEMPWRSTWVPQVPRILHRGEQSSSRSSRSSPRRTVRESFGEKINDPATALGRLRISHSRSMRKGQSPKASPVSIRPGPFSRASRSPPTSNLPTMPNMSPPSRSPPSMSPMIPSPLSPSPTFFRSTSATSSPISSVSPA
ncbi:hypothetical protein B0T26DRAFT_739221 [Lasiosphaeria miniovina]|uniref:Uncharacterized protein n=1 Tax=Lasiosphaeria miniovina TaxID=1954250 RepID=A0AA40ATM0_9PEZI|nr:uncharacterized protein B0T26DRAFT_739221 [Lasiosphaeria miniovina]KAK0721798.1 hypothetical protein B0T26DRAFT_739221 [Lasiosphaeria miniovina]